MDQGPNLDLGLPLREGILDLAEAGHHLASLGGHRERLDRAAHQQAFRIGGQGRRDADVALEALTKLVTPDGFCNRPTRG